MSLVEVSSAIAMPAPAQPLKCVANIRLSHVMKRLARTLLRSASALAVLPLCMWYCVQSSILGAGRTFPALSQLMSLLPGTTGVYLRQALYRQVLPECGDDASIGFGVQLTHPETRIGSHVYIGHYAVLGRVVIERDVLIGSFVSIMNGSRQHGIARLDIPVREQPGEWPLVTIGADSWIGDHAVVMADVGRHCVVAAGAVVVSPVPDYAIVAGCPARILRYRDGRDADGQTP